MASHRVQELKQKLDVLLRDADLDDLAPDERLLAEEAARNFTSGGTALLDAATEFMWAYYKDFVGEFTPAERSEYGLPELRAGADIWDEVEFRHPPEVWVGDGPLEPGPSYISFEGDVSWEREHGLQLVFEHGERVCKVGPYDGHLTNAHAYGDPSLLGVIYKGSARRDEEQEQLGQQATRWRWFRRK